MSDTTQDLADQAAEAIQSLCRLTRGEEALKHPGDVCEVVAGLQTMAARLPRLFAQLASWLVVEVDGGRLEHDSGEPAGPWIRRVNLELSYASSAADQMAAAGSGSAAASDRPSRRYMRGLSTAHPRVMRSRNLCRPERDVLRRPPAIDGQGELSSHHAPMILQSAGYCRLCDAQIRSGLRRRAAGSPQAIGTPSLVWTANRAAETGNSQALDAIAGGAKAAGLERETGGTIRPAQRTSRGNRRPPGENANVRQADRCGYRTSARKGGSAWSGTVQTRPKVSCWTRSRRTGERVTVMRSSTTPATWRTCRCRPTWCGPRIESRLTERNARQRQRDADLEAG
jgi:hypothetical protein